MWVGNSVSEGLDTAPGLVWLEPQALEVGRKQEGQEGAQESTGLCV